jgi:serine/threonine protein kinase
MGTQAKLGTLIGGHRIADVLGGGEVGRVFACKSPDTEQLVAIKVLRTKHARLGDALMKSRTSLERIESPHVAKIYDVAVFNNVAYVVMELVEGESLQVLLKQGPIRTVDALALARGILKGLQAAWAQGIAHGDVRPANILLPRGETSVAKLVDFLLAPPIEGVASVRGSPPYLAPELLAVGTPPDAMSDLYAVGCVLHEAITGKPPFSGPAASVLHAQAVTPAPSLAHTMPGAPQSIVYLVDRLLLKDRLQRIKTHGEAIDTVERALRGQGMAALKEPDEQEAFDINMDKTVVGAPERTTEYRVNTSAPAAGPEPLAEFFDGRTDGVDQRGEEDRTTEYRMSRSTEAIEHIQKVPGPAAPRDAVPDFLDANAGGLLEGEGERTAEYHVSPVVKAIERGRQGTAAPKLPAVPDFLDLDAGRTVDIDIEIDRTAEVHASPAYASAEPVDRSAKSTGGGGDIGVYRSSPPQEEEEKTQVQSGIVAIPSADDVGLVLTPVPPKK